MSKIFPSKLQQHLPELSGRSQTLGYTLKFALMLLIKHKVENRSLADITKQSKQMTHMMINCARSHLNGYDKRLKIQ